MPVVDAVAVTSRDIARTARFYGLLGFAFPTVEGDTKHLEAVATGDGARLMIDHAALIEQITGRVPKPATHSTFALRFDSPAEVDAAVAAVKSAGHKVEKEPWDAVWGQRYAQLRDPDGVPVDLYAPL